jgi:hypothetical protein
MLSFAGNGALGPRRGCSVRIRARRSGSLMSKKSREPCAGRHTMLLFMQLPER